jgi:hypothetical protein
MMRKLSLLLFLIIGCDATYTEVFYTGARFSLTGKIEDASGEAQEISTTDNIQIILAYEVLDSQGKSYCTDFNYSRECRSNTFYQRTLISTDESGNFIVTINSKDTLSKEVFYDPEDELKNILRPMIFFN